MRIRCGQFAFGGVRCQSDFRCIGPRPTLKRMRPDARTSALVLTVLVGTVLAGWFLGRPALDRRHDVATRRSLYRSFPTFPGAVKVDERAFELESDGVGTGDYGLTPDLPAGHLGDRLRSHRVLPGQPAHRLDRGFR